jgi:Protein of unknown function (DUF4236)
VRLMDPMPMIDAPAYSSFPDWTLVARLLPHVAPTSRPGMTGNPAANRERRIMGFRFMKRFGFGLFKLNLSGSGMSLSTGIRGASINIPLLGRRRRKPSVTVSLPGTGLSYRQSIGGPDPKVQAAWATHVADRIAEEKAEKHAASLIALGKTTTPAENKMARLMAKNEVIKTEAARMHQFALDVPKATVKEKQAMWVEVEKLFGDVKSARQDVLDMRGDCIPEKLADETIANLDEQINTLASVYSHGQGRGIVAGARALAGL